MLFNCTQASRSEASGERIEPIVRFVDSGKLPSKSNSTLPKMLKTPLGSGATMSTPRRELRALKRKSPGVTEVPVLLAVSGPVPTTRARNGKSSPLELFLSWIADILTMTYGLIVTPEPMRTASGAPCVVVLTGQGLKGAAGVAGTVAGPP